MKNYLTIKNLSYSYPDGHLALNKISFDLSEKESLAILGPNGAGKTTLICLLYTSPSPRDRTRSRMPSSA